MDDKKIKKMKRLVKLLQIILPLCIVFAIITFIFALLSVVISDDISIRAILDCFKGLGFYTFIIIFFYSQIKKTKKQLHDYQSQMEDK